MSRILFPERAVRVLIALLLGIKLLVTAWDCHVYCVRQYDDKHHAARAQVGGLVPSVEAYNPPPYYLPALLSTPPSTDETPAEADKRRLGVLRHTNIAYLGLFYLLWIYVIFPRLLGDWRRSSIASLLLLVLPGYQKLAVMAHPDNLHTLMAAACMATWLVFREEKATALSRAPDAKPRDWLPIVVLAIVVGLAGLTRPFAAATVVTFWIAAVLFASQGRPLFSAAWSGRVAVLTVIVGLLSSSWYVYRAVESGEVGGYYKSYYVDEYAPYREDFDRVQFFTTFHFAELLQVPNREVRKLHQGPRYTSPYANSFFTILYSEIWGDHWLYTSSAKGQIQGRFHDDKVWPKRALFVAALPLTVALVLQMFAGVGAVVRRLRQSLRDAQPSLIALGMFLAGSALYLWWQQTNGLLPGKNSTIKFIYSAHLGPFALGLAMMPSIGPRRTNAWVLYLLVVFMLALPIAIFWPAV